MKIEIRNICRLLSTRWERRKRWQRNRVRSDGDSQVQVSLLTSLPWMLKGQKNISGFFCVCVFSFYRRIVYVIFPFEFSVFFFFTSLCINIKGLNVYRWNALNFSIYSVREVLDPMQCVYVFFSLLVSLERFPIEFVQM